MNRLITFLLATLIICPAAQAAVAITTNPVCKKLVTAINQAQKLESCKAAWQGITKETNISAQHQTAILDQALQLAQTQKAVLDEELANLGDETKNRSKIKWGAGQLALGCHSAAAFTVFFLAQIGHENAVPEKILFPSFLLQELFDVEVESILGERLTRIALIQAALSLPAAMYFLYKGYHNLKQGLNYKQFLQDKITNLDAIISYLQDLQTNNESCSILDR